MEIWFGATGLRLHREAGAVPNTGAKSHASPQPASQLCDEEEGRTSIFSVRMSTRHANASGQVVEEMQVVEAAGS